MKTMKKVISVLLLVCVLASFATVSAYADSDVPAAQNGEVAVQGALNYVKEVTLSPSSATLNAGDTVTITPSTPNNSDAEADKPVYGVTWGVSNESALVKESEDSQTGAVTFRAQSVNADTTVTVTATAKGFASDGNTHPSATCKVTIKKAEVKPVASVVILEPASRNVRINTSITLKAEVTNGDFAYWEVAYGSTGKGTFDVVSGNKTVNFTGTAVGTVKIVAYAKDGTASAPLELNVTDVRTPQVACSVGRIDNGETATFWVTNAEADETFTWSYITSPATAQIITKANDRGVGLDLTGGKGEGTVTVTAKDKYGATASITVPVNVMDTGDAKLSPTNVTWTRGQGNLTFTVEPVLYSAYIDGVCITGSGNNNKYSYVWSSKNLVINSSYLATLSAGEHILRVDTVYGSGEGINQGAGTVYATITINGTASAAYGDNAHVRGTSSNLYFNSNSSISKVYISNQLIDPANYTLSANGKSVTLKANFLNLLNYGSYTMKLENTSGGTETATFRIVTANYAPATGDESNLAIWVAVMLISGVGAFALIPRRKKEM